MIQYQQKIASEDQLSRKMMCSASWNILLLLLFQFQNGYLTSEAITSVYGFNLFHQVEGVTDNGTDILDSETDPADIPLFYGWFFDADSSLSLLRISQLYFSSCFNRVPEFIKFIYKNMRQYNITNPFAFFRKPLDPDSLRPDNLYHVTAKFCDRLDCSSYAKIAAPYVGKVFQIHIIGLFFTENTYGYRIRLLAEEEDLFVEKTFEMTNRLNVSLERPIFNAMDYSRILSRVSGFPEVHFLPQKLNFHPSDSKAHSTIGCAPNIEAVQTGLDLRMIEAIEASYSPPHKDFQIGVDSSMLNLPGAILRRYGEKDQPLAFVVYPRDEMIVPALFRYYI